MKKLILFISFAFFVNTMEGQTFSDKITSVDSCQVINELLKLAILNNALPSSNYFSATYEESYAILEVPAIFSFGQISECILDNLNAQYQFLLVTESQLRELREANEKTRF